MLRSKEVMAEEIEVKWDSIQNLIGSVNRKRYGSTSPETCKWTAHITETTYSFTTYKCMVMISHYMHGGLKQDWIFDIDHAALFVEGVEASTPNHWPQNVYFNAMAIQPKSGHVIDEALSNITSLAQAFGRSPAYIRTLIERKIRATSLSQQDQETLLGRTLLNLRTYAAQEQLDFDHCVGQFVTGVTESSKLDGEKEYARSTYSR